jgi:hypothetical protein
VAIPRRLANILIPPRFCAARPTATGKAFRSHLRAASVVFGMAAAVATLASQAHAPSKRPKRNATASVAQAPAKPRATAGKSKIAQHPYSNVRERELEKLARALRDNPTGGSYAALSAFARSNARNELGSRAALALGYYDLSRGKADLALNWLHRAANETLLREYVLYWESQAYLALGRQEEALAELENLRHDFPASVMNEQIVTSLAQTPPLGLPCFFCARRLGKSLRRPRAGNLLLQPPIISTSTIDSLLTMKPTLRAEKFLPLKRRWVRSFPGRRCRSRSLARNCFTWPGGGTMRAPTIRS